MGTFKTQKMAQRRATSCSAVVQVFKLRLSVRFFPNSETTPEGLVPHLDVIDIDRLRANLQVSRRSLRTALIQDAVRPRWSTSFRFCRLCLGYGYHSIVHQFESVNVCPAHRCAVESACRRCGHKIPYRINVQLLEAQYRWAKCLASYANVFWTPSRARPMKPGHRKAFTRRYMDRRRG